MDHLQRSIQADPSVIEPYTDLGMVYIDKKEYALAEKTLAHAIQMSPNDYLSNQRLLILFQRTKDPRANAQAIRVQQLRKTGEETERLLNANRGGSSLLTAKIPRHHAADVEVLCFGARQNWGMLTSGSRLRLLAEVKHRIVLPQLLLKRWDRDILNRLTAFDGKARGHLQLPAQ